MKHKSSKEVNIPDDRKSPKRKHKKRKNQTSRSISKV